MIKLGCLARYFNSYELEIKFAQTNKFDFMQLWYDSNGLYVNKEKNEDVNNIKNFEFPSIVHAVLDINEFEKHLPIIKNILNCLGHKELIIHPICVSEQIDEKSIKKLNEKIKYTLEYFGKEVKIYLENNSKFDPIFQSKDEIEYIFKENPNLEFLLDIAHIESYQHLSEMIKIKYPKILHVADKHFNIIHEHLPLGKGDIDYKEVFSEYLSNFEGKIILEVFQSDEEIIASKKVLDQCLTNISFANKKLTGNDLF